MLPDLLETLRCPATGGRLSLDAHDRAGDDVRHGVLRSEAEEYPIVAGIPVLLPDYADVVGLLRAGRTAEASAAALLHQLQPSRLGRLVAAVGAAPRAAAAAGALARLDRRRLLALIAPLLDADARDPMALVRLGFDGWGEHNPEAVNYFTYRFGTPRHLVALAAAEAGAGAAATTGLVLDLGCGAGHLTWSLAQRFPDSRTVGLDVSLFELWAASGLVEGGRFVCGDARMQPLASGSFGLVLASDMLSFVRDKWAVAREGARVLAEGGTLAVAAVKSSLQSHVYAGMPLTPEGWRCLAGPLPHQLFADDRVLERYFDGVPIDAADPGDATAARTVTLLAGARAGGSAAGAGGRWPGERPWPHALGPLGVNPLLRLAAEREGKLIYRRWFPSDGFAADNLPLADYLPEEVVVPRTAVHGDRLDPHGLEDLVASTAVLALPRHYRAAQLPAPARHPVGAG